MPGSAPWLLGRCLAEFVGTFFLVFFGCGSVHTAVLVGAQTGLWQVAIVWGVAIMVAIYVVGAISGAHINPAITLPFYLWRGFPAGLVVPYIISQLAGAMLAAASLFVLFTSYLEAREKALQITRGEPGSEMTAMCYGEYYPNPGGLEAAWREANKAGADSAKRAEVRRDHLAMVSERAAFFAEFLGTLILALVVFAVTDERNLGGPGKLAPVFIGLTIAILISVIAPLTQACFNPARDFGPRLFAYGAGWGEAAIPGPNGRGFVTVYILAPILGGLTGGGFYQRVLRPQMPGSPEMNS